MNSIFETGNAGEKHRSDCHVRMKVNTKGPSAVHMESPRKAQELQTAVALGEKILAFYELENARLLITDQNAPDFVLAARIEACIKQYTGTEKSFTLSGAPRKLLQPDRKRMRVSRLYVPGNSPKMIINASLNNPHAVILDLEDSVPVSKKPEARLLVRNALRMLDFGGVERMVRINKLPLGMQDLEQVVSDFVDVILIPKCESAEEVNQVNEKIDQVKKKNRINSDIFLIPIIESAKGVIESAGIVSAADNVVAMSIGLEDYTADIGVERSMEGTESFYARSHMVTACKAFGRQALDSVFSDVGDPDGLAATIKRSKALGFEGMGCIHPRQIKTIHDGYAPTEDEINKAEKIISAFEEAGRKGLGVIALGTKMIDPPVVERAQRIIELSRYCRPGER